jgi:hypothetical protein
VLIVTIPIVSDAAVNGRKPRMGEFEKKLPVSAFAFYQVAVLVLVSMLPDDSERLLLLSVQSIHPTPLLIHPRFYRAEKRARALRAGSLANPPLHHGHPAVTTCLQTRFGMASTGGRKEP